MQSFRLVMQAEGSLFLVGAIQETYDHKFIWHALGHRSRNKFETKELALKAAQRTFGNTIQIDERE